MTILVIILAGIVGFLWGLMVCHHYGVVPLSETETKLRQELRKLRGELWARGIEVSNLRTWIIMRNLATFRVVHPGTFVPVAIPHRAHSDVLRINSIDDLIEGTRP